MRSRHTEITILRIMQNMSPIHKFDLNSTLWSRTAISWASSKTLQITEKHFVHLHDYNSQIWSFTEALYLLHLIMLQLTNHYSSPCTAVICVCMYLCVWTITFELNDQEWAIPRSSPKIKVTGRKSNILFFQPRIHAIRDILYECAVVQCMLSHDIFGLSIFCAKLVGWPQMRAF